MGMVMLRVAVHTEAEQVEQRPDRPQGGDMSYTCMCISYTGDACACENVDSRAPAALTEG